MILKRYAPQPQALFVRQKRSRKKSVTQVLAAASGVPPAFHKQVVPCCIFRIHRKCRQRAGGIAVQFGALHHVTEL